MGRESLDKSKIVLYVGKVVAPSTFTHELLLLHSHTASMAKGLVWWLAICHSRKDAGFSLLPTYCLFQY